MFFQANSFRSHSFSTYARIPTATWKHSDELLYEQIGHTPSFGKGGGLMADSNSQAIAESGDDRERENATHRRRTDRTRALSARQRSALPFSERQLTQAAAISDQITRRIPLQLSNFSENSSGYLKGKPLDFGLKKTKRKIDIIK